ncbi:MAG: T9SS type A sorting domain-containing protein [Candidatus Poribacteria bacterium]|nr:T9SS type A sorting domain-containing protein [Candidatus Poribacteria bacterium]
MMRRAAVSVLAALAVFWLSIEKGAAQKLVGQPPGTVWRAALSSDGKLLATGDTNGLVSLWSAETGELVSTLGAYQNEVDWLKFWADDRYLVSSSFYIARIWDVETGKMAPVSNEISYYGVIAFSPDNRTVAASKWGERIYVWDVETGEALAAVEPGSEQIRSLVFSHDGRLLAGAGKEAVYVWDVETAQLKTRFNTPVDARDHLLYPSRYRIAFLPDNRLIASVNYTGIHSERVASVYVWDAAARERLRVIGEGLTYAEFAPDGSAVAGRSGEKSCIWDLSTGEALMEMPDGFGFADFSPDSRTIAAFKRDVWNRTMTIQVWDLEKNEQLAAVENPETSILLFASNGRLAGYSPYLTADAPFHYWDVEAQKQAEYKIPGSSPIRSVSFSPDGRCVATSSVDGYSTSSGIHIWDVSTGEEKRSVRAYPGPSAFSPDGRTVAGVSEKYAIGVWDAETGEPVAELKGYSPSSFAYTPDGKTLAFNNTTYKKGIVRFLDISTGEAAEALTAPSGWASELSFSRDGSVLAAAGGGGSVHLWDVEKREVLRTVKGIGSVHALALSPDGRSIAVGGEDSVRVWSAENGALRGKMVGHEGAVRTVAYSPDGRHIASAGDDGTVRVWSAETFALTKTLRGHVGYVNSVAFSPDSRSLVSGGKDGRVLLWGVEDLPIQWSDIKREDSPLLLKNALLPNYPNPFNPETWIPFDLAQESSVTIAIYNSAGRTVKRMELGELAAGSYRAKGKAAYWDGRDALGAPAASGVYYVRIEAGSFSETRRMVLSK